MVSESGREPRILSTKEKMLKVAEQIFAQKGYDGSCVDEIAAKSGINKGTLYKMKYENFIILGY